MRRILAMVALAGGTACGAAAAQTVSLSGSLGDKALLIIDGAPRTLATGSTVQGVRLLSVSGNDAVVEIKGKRVALTLGGVPVDIGAARDGRNGPNGRDGRDARDESRGLQIVLSAGSGGHFISSGSINGRAVRFLVDTGATFISMSQAEAQNLGLDYRSGQRIVSNTANGPVQVYRVSLASVRLGDVVVYDVDAVVVPMPMDFVLLGNSFLTRFQMKRENEIMTLTTR